MLGRKASATFSALGLAAALSACGSSGSSSASGSSGSSGASPAAYVQSVCTAVGPFEKDVLTRSSALNLSTITNVVQGKKSLQDFLSAITADTGKAVNELKAAGSPNVSNGKAISNAIVSTFTQLDTGLAQAATQAGSLPTNSPQAFRTAAQALGASIRTSMSGIGSGLQGLKSPELEKAAKSSAACKAIGA